MAVLERNFGGDFYDYHIKILKAIALKWKLYAVTSRKTTIYAKI